MRRESRFRKKKAAFKAFRVCWFHILCDNSPSIDGAFSGFNVPAFSCLKCCVWLCDNRKVCAAANTTIPKWRRYLYYFRSYAHLKCGRRAEKERTIALDQHATVHNNAWRHDASPIWMSVKHSSTTNIKSVLARFLIDAWERATYGNTRWIMGYANRANATE